MPRVNNGKTTKTSGLLMKRIKKNTSVYLIFLPTLLYYFIFKYIPMFGTVIAFQDYSITKGFFGSEFIGLEHFRTFLSNYKFFELLRNTLVISGLNLLLGFPAPIIFALLLNETKHFRFKKAVQTITYMPHFISMVVICGIIRDFTKDTGVITQMLMKMGIETGTMLSKPNLFLPIYILSDIWQETGWNAIIYMAALAGVDQQLYDAASVDGANGFQKLLYVTIPSIMPTIVIMLILRLGSVLNVGFEKILLLYNPGIYETSDVISTYVYRKGLLEFNYSYSTAVNLFNSVINFLMLILANNFSKKVTEYSLW